jgi:hypothetical protein
MIKSFSLRNRFLALLCCAVISLFACSSEKSASHEDKCKSSVAECLTDGSWELERISDATRSTDGNRINASGTLIFTQDNKYEFVNGRAEGYNFTHYGTWMLADGKLNVNCTSGDIKCTITNGNAIDFKDNYMTLEIRGTPRTPFTDFRDQVNIPDPVEKYRFRQ